MHPGLGRFEVDAALLGRTPAVSYHYGFSSTIGAGPYDRRTANRGVPAAPVPLATVTGGGTNLATALTGLTSGTVRIGDSLTYDTVSDVGGAGGLQHVRIDSENTTAFTRPCIRAPAGLWSFTGAADAVLELDGLLVSGTDVVLDGLFDRVRISCSTFDPGGSGTPPAVLDTAADGRDLAPTHLWVRGRVRLLEVDRCVLGPVRTRDGGHVETLTMSDTIVQAVRTTDPSGGQPADPALDLDDGTVTLERCTVLGPAALHRLRPASACSTTLSPSWTPSTAASGSAPGPPAASCPGSTSAWRSPRSLPSSPHACSACRVLPVAVHRRPGDPVEHERTAEPGRGRADRVRAGCVRG